MMDRLGRFWIKKKGFFLTLFLGAFLPVCTGFYSYYAHQKQKKFFEKGEHIAKLAERSYTKRMENKALSAIYRKSNPNFVQEELGAFPLLKKERSKIEKALFHPLFRKEPFLCPIKKKLQDNALFFEKSPSSKKDDSLIFSLKKPVLISLSDLALFLDEIERLKAEPTDQKKQKPPLHIASFSLEKKGDTFFPNLYSMNVKLVQKKVL